MKASSLCTGLGWVEVPVTRHANDRKMETNIIELWPSMERQTINGFGGALTHASGDVLNHMDPREAQEVINNYYDPCKGDYRFVRIPIDSCDFSPSQFNAASSVQDIQEDWFDFSYDERYIFPWLDEICKAAKKNIPILFSPWSPPAFMKDNHSRLQGGHLLEQMRSWWAQYLVRYLKEYQRRGYHVWGLTIQNEPNAVQTWDSCLYSAEEERDFLKDYLKPEMDRQNLQEVKVFFWDHNKERLLSRSKTFLTQNVASMVAGIAFHGYCGDHFQALELYRKQHPDHQMILSEFCMGVQDRYDFTKQLAVYGHEFLGDLAYGADTFLDWNLILDQTGGPNHVGNYCMAPIMTDKAFHPWYTMAFSVLRTLSSVIVPESKVIEHTAFTNKLDIVAVKRPDESICLIIGATHENNEVNVRIGETVYAFPVRPDSLTIFEVGKKEYE
ncbi:MAG: hypothetical protein LKE28_07170 [Sphaerochaeta sp.]|jgi:glucosylceramidase|nr:hypothetical protein [Sphaerochaeta sp.]